MSQNKHPSEKKRLGKAKKQTRWAPFWIIPKALGKGRVVHPSRLTRKKRNWRRDSTGV
jgi:ribosomal protein L39E